MVSISAEQAAEELLACCLNGEDWPGELIDRLIQPDGNRALFAVVVERLADLFEPRLCDTYAALFSEVIARCVPGAQAGQLLERYNRVRRLHPFDRDPARVQNIFVLSRVTLGADVAITSIVLDAAKRLFPKAAILFVGPEKNWELFAGDSRLCHLPISYARSASLADRLATWPALRKPLDAPYSIVIDPDSRLTQLGLVPVCTDENYFFFESRSYNSASDAALPELTRQWLGDTFGINDAKPFIAPRDVAVNPADVTVSFGVGENETKRIGEPFEENLIQCVAERGESILIDRGAGGEEAERVERAVARSGATVRMWEGSFAGFAAHIARSRLYIGYDSAGGHVAAACGVPLISIFGGFASERMFQRWRPTGKNQITIIRASDPASTLECVKRSTLENHDQKQEGFS